MASQTDSIRLLHVDDEPDLANLTAEFLQREDERFSVETAESASEALDRLDDIDVDCIISDYDMAGMSGIEFLEAVREDNPDLPFILYTGKGSQEVASDAISAGVTEYLQKESGVGQYAVLANRVANAVDQYRHTERAEALERTRRILQKVNQTLVRARTREAIEEGVCRILSEAEPYRFAWVGEYDADTQTVVPRDCAGKDESFLEAVTIQVGDSGMVERRVSDVDATEQGATEQGATKQGAANGGVAEGSAIDRGTAEGPTGRAIRHREVTTSWAGAAGAADEAWLAVGEEYGFRACAAIPLVYDERLYGVVTVYGERAEPFDDRERELLVEVGEDIAHAIRRVESEQARRRFEQAVEQAGHAVFITDPTGTIEYVNPAFERITGYTAEEARGAPPRLLNSDEMDERYYDELWKTILAGETWEQVVIDQRKTGELYTADQTIAPITDESGEITAFVAIQNDITDRVERKRELEAAQARFRALTDNSGVGVVSIDHESTIRYANDTVEDILGYAPADLEGESLLQIIPERYHEAHREGIERYLESGDKRLDWSAIELPARHADGHEVRLAISFGEASYEGTHYFTALLREVSEETAPADG